VKQDADDAAIVQLKLENQVSDLTCRFQAVKRHVYRLLLGVH
jgi:hypothetical protein